MRMLDANLAGSSNLTDPSSPTRGGCEAVAMSTVSTARMVEEAAAVVGRMLAEGAGPQDILLVAANRNMLDALEREGVDGRVQATTYGDLVQSVLSYEGAAKAAGRADLVLLPSDEKVLLEDLKVSGLKVGRLREMLKFFFKGITEGSDADPAWLINGEETSLFDFMRAHLAERGAILACERGSVALRCLDDAKVLGAFARRRVVACGYTSLDLCGQRFVGRLATERLVALGSDHDAGVPQIAYPHVQGLCELVEKGAEAVDLDAAEACGANRARTVAGTVCARLAAKCAEDAPLVRKVPSGSTPGVSGSPADTTDSPLIHICLNPQEEFEAAAGIVRDWIAEGAEPSEVLVVAPSRAYVRGVSGALDAAGVAVQACADVPFGGGDPRKSASNGQLRFLSALGLVADPESAVCWRSWLGLGDWLLRSDAWEVLRRIARERDCGMLEALRTVRACLAGDGGVELGPQATAVAKFAAGISGAETLIASCSGLEGEALIREIARQTGWEPGPVERAAFRRASGGDAEALYAEVRRSILDRACDRTAVAVALADACPGSVASHVLVCGMVDGYLPCYAACDENETLERQAKRAREERRRLLGLVGMARKEVAFTAFSQTDVETAERSHVDIGRIYVRKGVRLATAKPSSFLWECEGDMRQDN